MVLRFSGMSECKFAEDWENQEGWLVMSNGELVCLDWDEYCTKCRVDDSRDWTFTVSAKLSKDELDPMKPDRNLIKKGIIG